MSDDLAHVAAQLTIYLAPFTPWLARMGEGMVDKAAGDAWEGLKAIWERLRPAVTADPEAHEALLELSAAPDDEDLQRRLRVQLHRLLAQDDELASTLAELPQVAHPSARITGIVNRRRVYGGEQYGIVGEVHHHDGSGSRG
jgi:hypothetical protein